MLKMVPREAANVRLPLRLANRPQPWGPSQERPHARPLLTLSVRPVQQAEWLPDDLLESGTYAIPWPFRLGGGQ